MPSRALSRSPRRWSWRGRWAISRGRRTPCGTGRRRSPPSDAAKRLPRTRPRRSPSPRGSGTAAGPRPLAGRRDGGSAARRPGRGAAARSGARSSCRSTWGCSRAGQRPEPRWCWCRSGAPDEAVPLAERALREGPPLGHYEARGHRRRWRPRSETPDAARLCPTGNRPDGHRRGAAGPPAIDGARAHFSPPGSG